MATGDLSRSVETAEAQVYSFGSAAAVLNASPFLLRKRGLLACHIEAIDLVRSAMGICLERRLERRPLLNNRERVLDYLHFRLAYEHREKVAVVFLTSRLRFLHYEEISVGSISSSPYCVRSIATRALEVNAGAIILAHNHPSGNPEPSSEDRHMGMVLQRMCSDLEIKLVDNLVISASGSRSLMEQARNQAIVSDLRNGKHSTLVDDVDVEPVEA
jgi:DNA repair protein RadC